MTDGPAAGWYPDPLQRFDHRYWDGKAWTHHVSRGGEATVDEAPAATAKQDTAAQAAASTEAGVASSAQERSRETTADADTTSPDVPSAEPAAAAATDPSATAGRAADREAPATSARGATAGSFAALGTTPEQAAQAAQAAAATGTVDHAAPATCSPARTPTPVWQPTTPGTTTNNKAVSSLIASIVWLGGLGSIAGIVLGVLGRREVERSEGRQSGAGIAMAGIVIGALGVLATVAVAGAVVLITRAIDDGSLPDSFGPDFTIDGSGQDAEGDLSYSLVDVALHQDLVLEERGRYAETVDELLQVGWIVSQTVDVQVFADGAKSWCVQGVSELDPTLIWTTSSDDPDGPGPGAC